MSTATVTLRVESKDFAAQLDAAGTNLTLLSVAAHGTSLGFKGLTNAARSSVAQLALSATTIERLEAKLAGTAASASKLGKSLGVLGDAASGAAMLTTAISGVATALSELNRVPQALASIEASGVTTRTIAEFNQMRMAIAGNQEAVEGFVNTAIARLGEFEQAAARSSTILRSGTRFDEQGQALRANRQEAMDNALSLQKLVNTKLDNAVTSTEALLGQYEVLSGGFTRQIDSEKVLDPALKLTQIARAGGMQADAGENVRLLVKSLQAYNLTADDAAKTAAVINSVVDQGITTIQELSNGFGAAGNSANKAGISIQALGASVALLTSQGQDTASALTGLQGIADNIINKTPEAAQEIAKLTYEGKRVRFDVAEVQAKGFTQALIDLYKAAGSSPQTLAKIFPDAVSYRTAIALLAQDGQKLQNIYESVNAASAQSLEEVAKIASDTRIDRMTKLANKFGEIIITVAQSVAPVVEPGLDALKRIADGFAGLPEPIKQAIGSWIAFQVQSKATVAALGALGDMLVNLGGLYLTSRAVGLLLSGQLGSELVTIKELIVQRKGLISVILQTIGINQRHRLSVEATTEAIKNQGAVAKTVAGIQQKASEVGATAAQKAREIIAANLQNAQATANQLRNTQAGQTVTSGVGKVQQLASKAASNPAIAQGLEGVKNFWQKITASIPTTPPTPPLTPPGTTTPTPPPDRALSLAESALVFDRPKLIGQYSKINGELSKTLAELEFQSRLYNGKLTAIQKLRQRYLDRAFLLEQAALSPEQYAKEAEKLNKLGAKIQELQTSIKAQDLSTSRLSARASRLQNAADRVGEQMQGALENYAQQFAPAIQAEARLERVVEARERARSKAVTLENTANQLAAISPNSPEAIAAQQRANLAAIKADSLSAKAQKIEAEYQKLLDSTGARRILLAEQGLAQVNFGGRALTYRDSGLEKILYGSIGENLVSLKNTIVTPLAAGLSWVTKNAIAAGTALGNLGKSAFTGEFAKNLKAGFGELITSTKAGGIGGLLTTAKNQYLSGTAAIGEKALPFLSPALAGAIGTLGSTVGLGALVLRDDLGRANLSREIQTSVADVFKKDSELRSRYELRAAPLAEIKLAVENLAKGQPTSFTQFSSKAQSPLTSGSVGMGAMLEGIGSLSKITELPSAIGSQVDRLYASITRTPLSYDPASAKVNPIRERLKQLEESSQITSEQFAKLDSTLVKMGQSGKIGEEKLREFNAQLDSIRAQEKPASKGVGQTIVDAVLGAPGELINKGFGLVDFASNAVGGVLGAVGKAPINLLTNPSAVISEFGKDLLRSQSNREGDALVGSLGSISGLIKEINQSADLTNQIIAKYREGGAIDGSNRSKLKAGQLLTSTDIERENLASASRISRNQNLVSGYDEQIKTLTEQLKKTKDEGNKSAINANIIALQKAKEAIEKNTESLKSAQAAFSKYNLETLPGLIRTLKETSNPDKAVALAAEDFNQIYQKDAQGKLTTYVKDVATLRQESAKYLEAVTQKYQVDNSGEAEAIAIERLKSVRDNQILLPTGDSGYRESMQSRLAITDQIIKIQQAATEKAISAKGLEIERIKLLTAEGSLFERDAQQQSAEIAIAVTEQKLAAKRQEIQEYAQFPRKVVELEREAAQIQIQLQQQVADSEKSIRERRFALLMSGYDLQAERVKSLAAQRQIGTVEATERQGAIEVARITATLSRLRRDRDRLDTPSPELDREIAKTEEQRKQTIANTDNQIFEARYSLAQKLLNLSTQEATVPLEIANKRLDATQKIVELEGKIADSNRDLLNTQLQVENARLENESRLTGDRVKQAGIELQQADYKLKTLFLTQGFERESLLLQQRMTELSSQRERNQLQIAKLEQERAVAELKLQQIKLNRDRSNSAESQAAKRELQLQLGIAEQQLKNLSEQEAVLDRTQQANRQITKSKLEQGEIQLKINRQSSEIDRQLKGINLVTTIITQQTEKQGLLYAQQIGTLTNRANILDTNLRQLDNQTKLLETQKGLLGAIADGRLGELGVLDSLTTIEGVKNDIAQRTAALKLSSLNEQIKLERQILELNLQQQQAGLERDRIKQSVSEVEGQRDLLKSRSEYQKLLAQGTKADPLQVKAAELDLLAKEQNLALVKSQRGLLDQQQQSLDYQAYAQRQQLDIKQKGELQRGLADYAKTLPLGQGANFENALFNAVSRQEGTNYYQEWAENVVRQAPPLRLPQFGSPYDPSSNYNRLGVPNPSELPVPRSGTRVGGLDLRSGVDVPRFQPVNIEQAQRDALARYQEFVVKPVSIKVSAPAPTPKEKEPQSKTIVVNLQMDNNTSINVADGRETKDTMTKMTFDAIEGVIRMVKEKY